MEWVFLTAIVLAVGWGLYKRVRKLLRRIAPRTTRYIPKKVKAYVYLRDGGICRHCEAKGRPGEPLQFDHIKPYSWGGKSVANNLQLLCKRCNEYKGNRYEG